MNEGLWNRLMCSIRDNNVIPIIGPQLLIGSDGKTSLQAQIAARLLQDFGKSADEGALPPFRELNSAVSLLKNDVKLQDLYYAVDTAIKSVTDSKDFVIPESIRLLSEITDFRLFVTLTPDDLLARSLRLRCAVNEIIHSPSLASSDQKDLPGNWHELSGEVYLLYLFGKSRPQQVFAIHDEDVLEYAHNLIVNGSKTHRVFLDELHQRFLLLIGCNFPEWLSRFILRAANRTRLSDSYRKAWLVEPLKPEESFTCFLNSYSGDTEILSDIPPIEFVAELHRRWTSEHGACTPKVDSLDDEVVPRGTMFFISYSRKTDLSCADALYQALLGMGVSENEIWLDRKTIEPGQDFQRRILDGIQSCRYFLPLLSPAANARERAFVFREWDEANNLLPEMNCEFIIPVVVDNHYEPECYTARPAKVWFDKRLDYAHAPGGRPDGRLEAKLIKLVRESRKQA